MQARTHYEVLELKENASQEDIRLAYKTLAVSTHPDKHPNDQENATIKFRAVHEAYEILSNVDKRAQYDGTLKTASPSSIYSFHQTASPSSSDSFHQNVESEIEKLCKQFPEQFAKAIYDKDGGPITRYISGLFSERTGAITIKLAGLSKEEVRFFEKQMSKIVGAGIPGGGWLCYSVGYYPRYDYDPYIDFGYNDPKRTKHLMELIEKVVNKVSNKLSVSEDATLQVSL